MKIDVSKIENYENMTAEEKLAALESYEVEEPKVVDSADEIAKLKAALNKASSDTASYKKALREKQTEQERLDAERAEKEAEREALLKSLMREKDVSVQKASFLSHGFSDELSVSTAEAILDGDFDTFHKNLKSFLDNKEKELRADILKATPKPVSGNEGGSTITKEQFDNMDYSEKAKLFEENKSLYDELNK